jgi:nucleotide-binding universal stress UspA family protein
MTVVAAIPESSTPAAPEPRPAPPIRQILFPSDLSDASQRAFHHARLLGEAFGARVTLYHVVSPPWHEEPKDPADPQRVALQRAEQAARERLDALLAGSKLAAGEVVVEHRPSANRALVARIAATSPDLTVMATHGREGLAHLFLGAVTETVVQYGRCPVLAVREPDHGAALPYRRVLVPTDLSPASRRAFPMAALLARTFGAEIVAVHVAPEPHQSLLSGVSEAVAAVPTEADVAGFLGKDFEGLRVIPQVFLGKAWDRIAFTARVEKADVIVMSTHGHDSLTDRVIGSHTERVVRHAPCPVLIV